MSVLLLHGAWQGSWAWDRLIPLLTKAGLKAYALDLPGNGSDPIDPASVSLDLYVDAVLRRVDTIDGPVSIVAHSGAGIVASQVAETCPERVARLVYVAGMMLPDGVSFAELVAPIVANDPSAAGIWTASGLVRGSPDIARSNRRGEADIFSRLPGGSFRRGSAPIDTAA